MNLNAKALVRTLLAAGLTAFAVTATLADDAEDCAAGIDKIRAEIAKNPAADKLEVLNKFLKDAEREAGEQEYDECLEAVEDAMDVAG
jgi:hypothetical protein